MRLVDEASAAANGIAVTRRTRGRPRRAVGAAAAAAGLLLLAGCAAPAGSPSLHEVPERPRLAATAEDREALAGALRADRAAAWREAAALRERTGKAALPPPAWLLEPVRPPASPATTGGVAPAGPNLEAAIVQERVRSESDDGSLNAFLRQLVRRQPAAEPLVLAADTTPADAVEPPAGRGGRAPAPPDSPALDRFLDQLGGRLAVGRPGETGAPAAPEAAAPAAPPVAAPRPAPAEPPAAAGSQAPRRAAPAPLRPTAPAAARVEPAPPSGRGEPALASLPPPSPGGTLPEPARAELSRAVEAARATGAGLEVVGHGATPALALERARAVAKLVAEAGLPPGGLALRAGGPGERVEIRRLPSAAE